MELDATNEFKATSTCHDAEKLDKLAIRNGGHSDGNDNDECPDDSDENSEVEKLNEFELIDKKVKEMLEEKVRKQEEYDLELLRSIGKHPDQLAAAADEDGSSQGREHRGLEKKDSAYSVLSGLGSLHSIIGGNGSRAGSPESLQIFTDDEEEEIKKLEELSFTRKQITTPTLMATKWPFTYRLRSKHSSKRAR